MALGLDSFAGQRRLTHSRFSKQKERKSKPHQLRETEAILGGETGLRPESGLESAPGLDSSFLSLGPGQSGRTPGCRGQPNPALGHCARDTRASRALFPSASAGLHPTAPRAPTSQSRGSLRVTRATIRRGWREEQPIGGRNKSQGWNWRNGVICFSGSCRRQGLCSAS